MTAASSVPAKWHNVTTKGCKSNGSACTYTAPDTAPLPDGTWTTGFSIRAPTSKADETATLNWAIPDPEIGYIDAGNDECYTSCASSATEPADRRCRGAAGAPDCGCSSPCAARPR